MNKSSYNAPKRKSARPSVSREKAQLNPQRHLMESGIKFSPVPIYVGGKKRYRLKLDGDGDSITDVRELEDEIRSAGVGLKSVAVEAVLAALFDVLPGYIARTGRAVRLGNLVTLKPYAVGSLDNANDAPSPEHNRVEIRASVCPAMRHSLARFRLVNRMRSVDGIDDVEGGDAQALESGLVDTANDVLVFGRNIYIPQQEAGADLPNGRAFLETLDGERIGSFAVTMAGPDLLHLRLKLEREPPSRDCRLVIETYGTREAAEAASGPRFAYAKRVRLANV